MTMDEEICDIPDFDSCMGFEFVSTCDICGGEGFKQTGKKCPFKMRCTSGIYECRNESCGKIKWHNHPMEESCDPSWDQTYWCMKCNEECTSRGHKCD